MVGGVVERLALHTKNKIIVFSGQHDAWHAVVKKQGATGTPLSDAIVPSKIAMIWGVSHGRWPSRQLRTGPYPPLEKLKSQ